MMRGQRAHNFRFFSLFLATIAGALVCLFFRLVGVNDLHACYIHLTVGITAIDLAISRSVEW